MNRLFKVAMFFTAFIPLWITVLFLDAMSIADKLNCNMGSEVIGISCIIIGLLLSAIIIFCSMRGVKDRDYAKYKILAVFPVLFNISLQLIYFICSSLYLLILYVIICTSFPYFSCSSLLLSPVFVFSICESVSFLLYSFACFIFKTPFMCQHTVFVCVFLNQNFYMSCFFCGLCLHFIVFIPVCVCV